MATEPSDLRIIGGYWAAQWYGDETDPRTGKPKRHTKRFGNAERIKKSEARRKYNNWLARWKHEPATRNPSTEGEYTIQKLADKYHDFAKGYYRKPDGRPTGEANSIWNSIRYVSDLYGERLAREFSPTMLKACREAMLNDGIVRTSINLRVNRIRGMFKWAVSNEIVPSSVLIGLQAVGSLARGRTEAKESDGVKPVTWSDVEKVLPRLATPVAAMVRLQWLTGMRPSEACTMRTGDIEMGGDIWLYRPQDHKTAHHGYERIIPLGPKAQKIVRPFLKRDLSAYLFSPMDAVAERAAQAETHRRENQKPNPRKTERRVGERYNKDSYRRAIEYAVKTVNREAKDESERVSMWSPNQLRHACATRIRKEYGLEASQVFLGHSKMDTSEIYAQIDADKACKIAAKMG